MRLPRDLSGADLVKLLGRRGYVVSRQVGSHIRLSRGTATGDQHVTVPAHDSLRVGSLNAILSDVAEHLGLTKDELISSLFDGN